MSGKALAPGVSGPSGPKSAYSSENEQYLPLGTRLIVIAISLMLAVFCVALDNTIMAVAIPKITDQFHALNDVGWYASSYLLTTCSFQLLYGKFYTLFNIKWLGSLVCGAAPTSTVLIVGRAIAGLGSAGIFTGALVTAAHTVPLEKRPIFFGLIGGMYGVASVAGPLLGGAFTEHATWRWLRGLDPFGTIIHVPAVICLLLALQWGGVEYPWSDGRIIALFVLFGVGFLVFIFFLQFAMSDDATVPVRIARQRSIAFASFFGLRIGASFSTMVYYIPIWFQAICGASTVRSGIDSLPMILANVLGIILSGALTTSLGYYAPFFIASSVITSLDAGFITTLTVDVSQSRWVGFLCLYGLGIGCGFQQGGVAAQAVLALPDVSVGTAVVMFLQMLGSAPFTSDLAALDIPSLDSAAVMHAGATGLRDMVTEEQLPAVLDTYNEALVKVFQLALVMGCLSTAGALGIEWRSVKEKSDGVATMQE
ncbi:hypothetical protein BDW72DRAFT_204746 [Aspergillus terricola var. indicus]